MCLCQLGYAGIFILAAPIMEEVYSIKMKRTPGGIRTHTGPGLSRTPLPIGLRGQGERSSLAILVLDPEQRLQIYLKHTGIVFPPAKVVLSSQTRLCLSSPKSADDGIRTRSLSLED